MTNTEVQMVLDADQAHRLDSRIRLLSGNVADNLTKLTDLIAEAKQGQIHLTLGFPSWTAYLTSALSQLELALAGPARRELVTRLADEGMSNRAIAGAVGVSEITVRRDKVQVRHDVAPERDPVEEEDDDGTDEGPADPAVMAQVVDELLTIAGRTVVEEPARVTGLDGKIYQKPPRKPKPKGEPATPPITFAALMKRLTDLNRVAAECLDIAEAIRFKPGANWSGLVYDSEQQRQSASALADNLYRLAENISDVVTDKATTE